MQKNFDDFYNGYSEKIDEYYNILKSRKKKIETFCVIAMALLIAVFLYLVLSLKMFSSSSIAFAIIGIMVIIIASFGAIVAGLKREMYTLNKKIMQDIIRYISDDNSSIYEPNKRISLENIEEMELFNLDNLKYSGKNVICTNYNGNNMNFADMEIYCYQDKVREVREYDNEGREYKREVVDKVKKTIFDGCYISATLNKRIAEHIYLIPNNFADLIINGAINDYITYSGDKVELENLEFSKKYRVYSDDETQARYVLSLALMEKINNIDDVLEGKKYIVFKEGRRFVICLEDFKIENIRKVTLPISKKEDKIQDTLKYIYNNISKLFEIYDILDLGNDLYVK